MGRLSSPSQVILIAEDEAHERFVRRYLYKVGYKSHHIDSHIANEGRGSGEQFVRDSYCKWVEACRRRSKSKKASTALVVVIDADPKNTVVDRRAQFQESLKKAGLQSISANERISHLVPKRHIETWILCLTGTEVDENSDYKNHRNLDFKSAANRLFELTRANVRLPDQCIPSLAEGISEARRLEV